MKSQRGAKIVDFESLKFRFAAHYLSIVREIDRKFAKSGLSARKALEKWDLEWPNIQAAHSYTVEEAADRTLSLLASDYAKAAEKVLPIRLQFQSIIQWHRHALSAATKHRAESARLQHWNAIGDACSAVGRLNTAAQYYHRVLNTAKTPLDTEHIATAYRGLGIVADDQGKDNASVKLLRKALRYASSLHDLALYTEILMHLAGALASLKTGKIESRRIFRKALHLARSCDPRTRSAVLSNFGRALQEWGETSSALRRYASALDISRQIRDPLGCAVDLCNIAEIYMARRKFRKASNYLLEAVSIAKQEGDLDREVKALTLLGQAYEASEEYEAAIEPLQSALDIHRQLRDFTSHLDVFSALSTALHQTGKGKELLKTSRSFLRQARRLHDLEDESTAWGAMGWAYELLGRKALSIRCMKRALQLSTATKDVTAIGVDLWNLGMNLLESGRAAEGLPLFQRALKLDSKIREKSSLGWDLLGVGASYTALGHASRAVHFLRRALSLATKTHDPGLLREATYHLGVALLRLGNTRVAAAHLRKALNLSRVDVPGQPRIHEDLANLYGACGEWQFAAAHLNKASEIFDKLGRQAECHRVNRKLQSLYESRS